MCKLSRTEQFRVWAFSYIATLIPYRQRYGMGFVAEKTAKEFFDPICMGMWEIFIIQFGMPVHIFIASNKALFQLKLLIIFLVQHENIYCGYSLEAPEALLMSTHYIYFRWKNKKKYLDTPLIWNYYTTKIGFCHHSRLIHNFVS